MVPRSAASTSNACGGTRPGTVFSTVRFVERLDELGSSKERSSGGLSGTGASSKFIFSVESSTGYLRFKDVLLIVAEDACESLGDIQWISLKNRDDVVEIEYFLLLSETSKKQCLMILRQQPQLFQRQRLLNEVQL